MTHQLVTCLRCSTTYDLQRSVSGVLPRTACPRCGDVSWTYLGAARGTGRPRPGAWRTPLLGRA